MLSLVWIVLIILWCCSCSLFKDNKEFGDIAKNIFIVCMVMQAGVIVASSVGLSFSTDIKSYGNDTGCSFNIMMDHLFNEEKTEELPKWKGVNNIPTILKNAEKGLVKIKEAPSDCGLSTSYYDRIDYDKKITAMETHYLKEVIKDPFNSKHIIRTVYANSLIDHTDKKSIIGKIFEFNDKIINSQEGIINSFKENVQTIQNDHLSVTFFLQNSYQNFDTFKTITFNLNKTMSENVSNLQNNLIPTLYILIIVLFSLSISFSTIIFIMSTIYIYWRVYSLKNIMHLLWNLSFLIGISSLILGTFIGFLAMAYLESPSAMLAVLTDETNGSKGFDHCLNNHGYLSTLILDLPGNHDLTIMLTNMYVISKTIKIEINNKDKNKFDSNQIHSATLTMQQYKQNITNTTANQEYEIALKKLKETTDNCSGLPKKQYEFVLHLKNCTDGFEDPVEKPGSDKLCFVLGQDNLERFKDCIGFNDTKDIIIESVNDNILKIEGVTTNLDELQKDFYVPIGQSIEEKFKILDVISTDYYNALNPSLGDDLDITINNMFNCSFLKNDLIKFIETISTNLSNKLVTIAIASIINGCFIIIGAFIIIPIIYCHSEYARRNEGIEEDDPTTDKKEIKPNKYRDQNQMIVQVSAVVMSHRVAQKSKSSRGKINNSNNEDKILKVNKKDY